MWSGQQCAVQSPHFPLAFLDRLGPPVNYVTLTNFGGNEYPKQYLSMVNDIAYSVLINDIT